MDGKGLMRFTEEMLRSYAAYVRGDSYNPKLNDAKDLNAEPFEEAAKAADKMKLPQVPAGKGGIMDKAPFLIQTGFEGPDNKPCHYLIKANAADYMKLAKACGTHSALPMPLASYSASSSSVSLTKVDICSSGSPIAVQISVPSSYV